jgi:alkylation response protein AidB-like acyl-CoA dehydrogenase
VLTEAARCARTCCCRSTAAATRKAARWKTACAHPQGLHRGLQAFTEGGWNALVLPPEWGGQGAPEAVGKLVEEMICATNVSFSLYPGLTNGAIAALTVYANDTLKQEYLPKMVSGEWSGTMCLTEPHCGTDLGLLRTRAEPDGDGGYKISGAKIFISAGEHDLTATSSISCWRACPMRPRA